MSSNKPPAVIAELGFAVKGKANFIRKPDDQCLPKQKSVIFIAECDVLMAYSPLITNISSVFDSEKRFVNPMLLLL